MLHEKEPRQPITTTWQSFFQAGCDPPEFEEEPPFIAFLARLKYLNVWSEHPRHEFTAGFAMPSKKRRFSFLCQVDEIFNTGDTPTVLIHERQVSNVRRGFFLILDMPFFRYASLLAAQLAPELAPASHSLS